MKKLILVLALISTSFGFSQTWENNWQTALKKAKENQQNIVLIFSGSDWCGPCIKLDQNVWQSEEFKESSKNHWVLFKADFPRKKGNKLPKNQEEENGKLAEKYNSNGYFPLVIVLSPEGKILGSTGYKKISAKEYIQQLKKFEI